MQTIPIQQGWNALYLEVEPEDNRSDAVFEGTPVTMAATYFHRYSVISVPTDPGQTPFKKEGWGVWYSPDQPAAFAKNLYYLKAGRAYLIRSDAEFQWTVTGSVKYRPMRMKRFAGCFFSLLTIAFLANFVGYCEPAGIAVASPIGEADDGQYSQAGDRTASAAKSSDAGGVRIFYSVWFVKTDGDDNADGETWDTAFQTIQKAIDSASEGHEILVEYGTYAISSSLGLQGKNVKLTSDDGNGTGWDDADYDRGQTVVDANGKCRLFTITGESVTDATVVRGFTFTDGNATYESSYHDYGKGILLASAADAVVEHCEISDCVASTHNYGHGGGIYICNAGYRTDHTPLQRRGKYRSPAR